MMLLQYDSDNLPYEKVGKNEPVCIADEVPFEIPDSWEWVRLKNLVKKEIRRGKSPKYTVSSNIQVFAQKCNVKTGGIDMTLAKYLDDTVFPKYPEEECMRDNDIVVNSTGNGTLGRIGMFHDSDRINENIIVPDSHVTVIRASEFLSADYFFYVLNYSQPYLEKSCSGSTNQTELKPAVISELFIPVPPVSEQIRIITKLIEALILSKKYGEKEILLQKYNQNFPEQLKKSILQYAVQGKLVPQNSTDEPASHLLERIRAEKQRFIKEGKIKKDKHESVIFRRDNSHYEKRGSEEVCIDDEFPFEVPKNWQWIRLSDLVHFIGGYAYKSETFIETSEYQVLRLGNIKNDKIKYSTKPVFISKELSQKTVDYQCKTNDILLTMTGTRLKRDYFYTVLVSEKDKNCFINQRVGCLRSYLPSLSRWLIWTLKSEAILSQVFQHETGTANQGNLGAENIMKTFIPLPPLDEQERICNVIDRLLRAVDTL
ncbi:type I restriction-modification system S subunit family protein [Lachnospiraceae bacterium CAG:215]|nr:type I restriction-modification system S subunit family protein [Lachnospiraceae bacterium CAG:215]